MGIFFINDKSKNQFLQTWSCTRLFMLTALLCLPALYSNSFASSEPVFSENLAQIKDKYVVPDSPYVVYFIQDAHCNRDAQTKIYEIITQLVEQQQVGLVAMEGAEGDIEVDDLRVFPYSEAKNIVSNYFLNQGKINGTEYYAINASNPVSVTGIEDRKLYLKNYNCLATALRNGDYNSFFDDLDSEITKLKSSIYSTDLLAIDKNERLFHTGERLFQDYLFRLSELADGTGCFESGYPNIKKCLKMIEQEKSFKIISIEKERAKLVRVITERMNRQEVADFLKLNLQFRLNKISYSYYIDCIFESAENLNIDVSLFSQLTAYRKYLKLHDEIEKDKVFIETAQLVQFLFKNKCVHPQQEHLFNIENQITVLRKALKLQLSSFEWKQLSSTPLFFENQDDISFLSSNNVKIISDDSKLNVLRQYYSVVRDFYEIALQRDSILVENLLSKIKSGKTDKAVIVAGGYHCDGISTQLREKNISYYVLTAKITESGGENLYASEVLGNNSKLEDFFSSHWNSLALSSSLEKNPLTDPRSRFVFGNMFKSLVISTVAWQMTGYDTISIDELNRPILQGIKQQLNEVANRINYDFRILEISRVDEQIYLRLSVNGEEIVYGLFAQRELVDWSAVAEDKVTKDNVLSEFQYLGGSVVVLTPETYDLILAATNRSLRSRNAKSPVVIRSLLANPKSAHFVSILGIRDLAGKKLSDIPHIASKISFSLNAMGIKEDAESVQDYLEALVETYRNQKKLTINDSNEIRFEWTLYRAAMLSEKVIGHKDGALIPCEIPELNLNIQNGTIKHLYLPVGTPLLIIEQMLTKINADLKLGYYDLSEFAGESFRMEVMRFKRGLEPDESLFIVLNTKERLPVLQSIDEAYGAALGEELVDVTANEVISVVFSGLTATQKTLSLARVDSTGSIIDLIGPSFALDLTKSGTLERSIIRLKQWADENGVNISQVMGEFKGDSAVFNILLDTVFGISPERIDEFTQIKEFKKILFSFSYASEGKMDRITQILSKKIVNILRGNDPLFPNIVQIVKKEHVLQGMVFDSDQYNIMYHSILNYINYNPGSISELQLEPVLLAKLLESIYIDSQPITPESVEEKILTSIRGGKYFVKLDTSSITSGRDLENLRKVFADSVAVDKALEAVDLSFTSVKSINVYRSRFQSFVSDYRVKVVTYQGNTRTIRLRVLNSSLLNTVFSQGLDIMKKSANSGIFPRILYSRTSASAERGNFYFAEHVDGVLASRIYTHPDEFSNEEKTAVKAKAARIWFEHWDKGENIFDGTEAYEGPLEFSNVITPCTLDAVLFPSDGSEAKILGLGYTVNPEPVSMYEMCRLVKIGLNLSKEELMPVLGNSMLAVFGWERCLDLIAQALAQAKTLGATDDAFEDLEFGMLMGVMRYMQGVNILMSRDSVKTYIDIAYGGNKSAALRDLSDVALQKGVSLIEMLNGKFAKLSKRLPSPQQARQALKEKHPSVLTITGGTGGNSLINAIKGIDGVNMANIVTTFDTGGQSYVWQDILYPLIGYVYSKGDVTNVSVAYLDDAKQELLNKRLPQDMEIDRILPLVPDLIAPTLKKYPELRKSPDFLIDFIDTVKKIDEFIDFLRKKHDEDPQRYKNLDLRKASLKNLIDEALNYFVGAYDMENGSFNPNKSDVAAYVMRELFGIESGVVIPITTQEGNIVAQLKEPLAPDKIQEIESEIKIDAQYQRNMITPDGMAVYGEHYIGEIGDFDAGFSKKISYLENVAGLDNQDQKPPISSYALEAMRYPSLDVILVGPGSLYTSILANFTVKEFVENLILRGKQQILSHPDGQKYEIEAAKRVFIVNPTYSSEDMNMSVKEICSLIERTAQEAVGDPSLRFEDMFDSIVMNNPEKMSDEVQEFVRREGMKVIQPTEDDMDFLAERGISVYSFDLASVRNKPTRTPGFDLQYTDKLEYSPEKLKLIANLFTDTIRREKRSTRKNLGIGSGFESPMVKERVKGIIKNGEVIKIDKNSEFFTEGRALILTRVKQLEHKLKDADITTRDKLERDLNFMKRVLDTLNDRNLTFYSVQPVDGSKGLFIDDASHYQFSTGIIYPEQGLKKGIYISKGFIDHVNSYISQGASAKSIANYDASDAFFNRAYSMSAELLFYQAAEYMLSQDEGMDFNPDSAFLQIRSVSDTYIGYVSSLFRTRLYEELSAIADQEVLERNIDILEAKLGITPQMSIQDKVAHLGLMLPDVRSVNEVKKNMLNSSIELSSELKSRLDAFFSLSMAEDAAEFDEINRLLKSIDFSSIQDMADDYIKLLGSMKEAFSKDFDEIDLGLWRGKTFNMIHLMEALKNYIASSDLEFDDVLFFDILDSAFSNIIDIAQDMVSGFDMLDSDEQMLAYFNLLNSISFNQMEHIHAQLNIDLRVDPKQRYPRKKVSDSIIEDRYMLSALSNDELEKWINNKFNVSAAQEIKELKESLYEFLSLFSTAMDSFPELRESTKYSEMGRMTVAQFTVARGMKQLQYMRGINDYSSILNFGYILRHPDIAVNFMGALRSLIPDDNISLKTIYHRMENLFYVMEGSYELLEDKIAEMQDFYPDAMTRLDSYLIAEGKLQGANIGLGDGHHTQIPDRINDILVNSDKERIDDEDRLFISMKEYLLSTALNLMAEAQTKEIEERMVIQNEAALMFRIYIHLNSKEFRFWQVNTYDKSPGLFIDDIKTFQFASVRGNDVYFAGGLIERLRQLDQAGMYRTAIAMFAEAVVHEVGEIILRNDLGDEFNQEEIHNTMKKFGFYLGTEAPAEDIEGKPQTALYYEINKIVNSYVNNGTTNVKSIPLFEYPADNPDVREELKNAVLSGAISDSEFLDIILTYFRPGIDIGAPEGIMLNNEFYHPGEVLGFVRDIPITRNGKQVTDTHIPVGERIIDLCRTDEAAKNKARDLMALLLSEGKYRDLIADFAPHELEDMMYEIIRIVTDDDDPYVDLKAEYNQKGLDDLDEINRIINESEDPLKAASLVAIAGNALDFADLAAHDELHEQGFSFVGAITEILDPDQTIVKDDFSSLADRLKAKPNQTIMYAIDNAGEIITDFPLLKQLLLMGHTVHLVTRDKHTVNDVSFADAQELFARDDVKAFFVDQAGNSLLTEDKFILTHSGSNVTGTDLRRAPESFIDLWQNADVRILKGQGNYETLRYYPMVQDMFFLVKVKDPVATANVYAKGDVLIEHKTPNPLIAKFMESSLAVNDFIKPSLSENELDLLEDFFEFYLDYLGINLDRLSLANDINGASELMHKSRELLDKAMEIPVVRVSLLEKFHRKIRNNSPAATFLMQFADTDDLHIDSNVINEADRQVIAIDLSVIPQTDLSQVIEIFNSIKKNRLSSANVQLVVYSSDFDSQDIISELLRRKIYFDGMAIVGKDNLTGLKPDANMVDKVKSVLENRMGGIVVDADKIKLITANRIDAVHAVNNNMFVIQLTKQDVLTSVTDFMQALISADSLINGGKMSDVQVLNINNGQQFPLSALQTVSGKLFSSSLKGKILQIQPNEPQKAKLKKLYLRREVDRAI